MTKINSDVCSRCICLPMCISKPFMDLMAECTFINDFIDSIVTSLDVDESATVMFNGLNMEIPIEKAETFRTVTDPTGMVYNIRKTSIDEDEKP